MILLLPHLFHLGMAVESQMVTVVNVCDPKHFLMRICAFGAANRQLY